MRHCCTWFGVLLASTAAIAACGPKLQVTGGPGTPPAASDSPTPGVSAPCGRVDMAVDRGPYVIAGIEVSGFFPKMGPSGWQEDDVALRQVVIVATVLAKEPAEFGGEAHVYTPFTVEVDRVIHGDARVGAMRVAVEGGAVGCYILRVDVAPAVELGRRYVFFLTDLVGAEPAPRAVWDAWPVDANGLVSTPQGPMPLAELVDRIDRLAAAGSSATP